MRLKLICANIVLLLMLVACEQQRTNLTPAARSQVVNGDSTLYGLVCDGSNDSILVFLHDPYDGCDPDTLGILEAMRTHHIQGELRVGDRVAIMRDMADSTKASIVVVTQDLMGQWCYKVKPRLKRRADMDSLTREELMTILPDSVRHLLAEEREYGFNLKIDSVVLPVGRRNDNDEMSIVEYPPMKRYRQWSIYNGRLVLTTAPANQQDAKADAAPNDTADIVMLTADTLVLRFADGEHSYYRRNEK